MDTEWDPWDTDYSNLERRRAQREGDDGHLPAVLLLALVFPLRSSSGEIHAFAPVARFGLLIPPWVGQIPCALCLLALCVHGVLSWRRTLIPHTRALFHRLTARVRHGKGASSRQGYGPDVKRTCSHRLARQRLGQMILRALSDGAPPWITLMLLAHLPVAISFEVAAALLLKRSLPAVSPLRWLVGATNPNYPWYTASLICCRSLAPVIRRRLIWAGASPTELSLEMPLWVGNAFANMNRKGWYARTLRSALSESTRAMGISLRVLWWCLDPNQGLLTLLVMSFALTTQASSLTFRRGKRLLISARTKSPPPLELFH